MTELVHVCHMNAKLLGIPRVYFCGNFVNHEITLRDITSLFAVRNLFEMNQVRWFFFRFSKSVEMLAGNKCQRCIEFRVMFRVELHFWQDFSHFVWNFITNHMLIPHFCMKLIWLPALIPTFQGDSTER